MSSVAYEDILLHQYSAVTKPLMEIDVNHVGDDEQSEAHDSTSTRDDTFTPSVMQALLSSTTVHPVPDEQSPTSLHPPSSDFRAHSDHVQLIGDIFEKSLSTQKNLFGEIIDKKLDVNKCPSVNWHLHHYGLSRMRFKPRWNINGQVHTKLLMKVKRLKMKTWWRAILYIRSTKTFFHTTKKLKLEAKIHPW